MAGGELGGGRRQLAPRFARDLLEVQAIEALRAVRQPPVGAARRICHADQDVALQAGADLLPVVGQVVLSGAAGDRNRRAPIRIADSDRVQAQMLPPELGTRRRRLAAMVFAVADQDQVGVAGCQLAKAPLGRAQRHLDRGPPECHRVRRGVTEALEEQVVVAGQRAEHVGAAGEGQQPEPGAALPLHRLDQLADGGLGVLEPVRPGVLGEHAVGHVEQHDHVPAEQRQRARALPPVRLHQRDDAAGDRPEQAGRAPPARPQAAPPAADRPPDYARRRQPAPRAGAGRRRRRGAPAPAAAPAARPRTRLRIACRLSAPPHLREPCAGGC